MHTLVWLITLLLTIKVLAVTFDGASVNRRLAKLHDPQNDVYKVLTLIIYTFKSF